MPTYLIQRFNPHRSRWEVIQHGYASYSGAMQRAHDLSELDDFYPYRVVANKQYRSKYKVTVCWRGQWERDVHKAIDECRQIARGVPLG